MESRRPLFKFLLKLANGIAGGVSLFHLSKIMGTSTALIGDVYGHLVPDSEEYLRGLLDNYDAATAAEGAR